MESIIEQEYLHSIVTREREQHVTRWLLSEEARRSETTAGAPAPGHRRFRLRRLPAARFFRLPSGLERIGAGWLPFLT